MQSLSSAGNVSDTIDDCDPPTMAPEVSSEVSPADNERSRKTDDSTLGQYRIYFRRWMTYCDAKTGGDYSVKTTVVLNFFNEVMFRRMTKKKISPEAGYSGQ
ncbi:hypothetical protein BGZ49_006437, partial [Haplosporangium sp. Z 27]